MGGKALKNTFTRRYQAGEFQTLKIEIVESLRAKGWLCVPVAAYYEKPSYGDMDIVVQSDPVRDIKDTVIELFKPNECSRNGDVLSFNYKELQIDLIMTAEEDMEFSVGYFAWNDLGNFAGRTAHRLGFKFGHDGLWYTYRDPDDDSHSFRNICITKNFSEALEFLGFDPVQWRIGFNKPEDIFAYAASSPYFDPAQFLLHNRSYAARKRDSTRKMYSDMLVWIKEHYPELNDESKTTPVNRTTFLLMARERWPEFDKAYCKAEQDLRDIKALKAVFNGEIVGSLFDREGKELGILMKNLREYFSEYGLEKWVRSMNEDDFREFLYYLELRRPELFSVNDFRV